MPPPKVLISYSHDNAAHEQRVLALANRLRSNGVDAILDQYEQFPPDGWIPWMKRQMREAKFILVICTETYRRRADRQEAPGVGLGATYEAQIIQQILYDSGGANNRIIPVLLDPAESPHIPLELRSYERFSVDTDAGYELLYRLLTNQPKIEKPVLGKPLALREARSDFRNVAWNAPTRNPFFTGRDTQLEAIHAAFPHPQSINGIGGVGKSQTAIEYAHRYRGDYQAVLWTVSGLAPLAAVLDLPEKNEKDLSVVTAAVRRWLESTPGWLLILDDLEDLTIVPTGAPGHILITTRQHASGGFADSVPLKKMDPDDGASLLIRRAKLKSPSDSDRAVARRLSIDLGGLPLALDQAGAFIEETPSTLAEYLDLYRAEGAALRARRGQMATGHDSVTVTFSLAFAKTTPAAAAIIRACAFLAPDAIPEEIFTQAAEEWGEPMATVAAKPLAWVQAIGEAGRFSLIHRDAKEKTLSIHRLVQDVVKDEMDMETRRTWADRAVEALNKVFPEVEFRNSPQCERLLPHARIAAGFVDEFDFESANAARLLNQTGYYLGERAEYSAAEPLYRRALAIGAKALGTDDLETATYLNNLAALYNRQGRFAEAEPLYRRALAIREKALELGPDHPRTATSLNNLAELFRVQGRYTEAETLFGRSLAILENRLGPDHPNTASSLNNLAGLFRAQGRYTEAEPLFRRALATDEKVLGPDHPNTASDLNNLAMLYESQGRYAEAELLCQRALGIYGRALGPQHPLTVNCRGNYTGLLRELDRSDEADALEAGAKSAGSPD
jgi:tetratricopeptide (TPR) repeat protein